MCLFKTCCNCISLRWGLMAWGYLKVFIDLALTFAVGAFLMEIAIMAQRDEGSRVEPDYVLFAIVMGFVSAADFVMSVILIMSCIKNSVDLLKLYYIHSIGIVGLAILWSVYYTGLSIMDMLVIADRYKTPQYFESEIIDILTYFAGAAILFYVMRVVKSQLIALENESQSVLNATYTPKANESNA